MVNIKVLTLIRISKMVLLAMVVSVVMLTLIYVLQHRQLIMTVIN